MFPRVASRSQPPYADLVVTAVGFRSVCEYDFHRLCDDIF